MRARDVDRRETLGFLTMRSLDHREPLRLHTLRAVAWRATVAVVVVLCPVVALLVLARTNPVSFLFDFKGNFYSAGHDIIHGRNPYRVAFIAAEASMKRAGGIPYTGFSVPVYPAAVLLTAVPFALIPLKLAGAFFIVLSGITVLVSFWLLGVRDWRCFAVLLASWPTVYALWLGTLNPLLLLGTAAAWRWRDHIWGPAVAVSSVIVAKIFLWPLGVWLLLTRRYRPVALAVLITVLALVSSWAVIGFDGMTAYPHMLSNLSYVEESAGPSMVAGLLALGLPSFIAHDAVFVLAACLLLAARTRLRGTNGEGRAFGLAIMAALVACPITWPHYLVLVFVPIALISTTFTPLWLLPMLTYLAPTGDSHHLLALVPWFAVETVVIVRLWQAPRARPDRALQSAKATERFANA